MTIFGNSYDETPYPSYPFQASHPDRLATVARLFGMRPAPVEHCRVLELGCAGGGNLMPMAETLPHSEFVGVDSSGRQIEQGRRRAGQLELENIRLEPADILEVNEDWGLFDYVICHGVFSWAPRRVQEQILTICRRNLSSHGVAYVNYNTQPGWGIRGVLRDMMRYHAGQEGRPAERARRARELLEFLARAAPADPAGYGAFLTSEIDSLLRYSDEYLFHQNLREKNDPLYFHEFAARAAARGLQYIGDSDVNAMWSGGLGPDLENWLRRLAGDAVRLEQYLDVVRNRAFRQTLLCGQDVAIDRCVEPGRLSGMYIAACVEPLQSNPDFHSPSLDDFRSRSGQTISTEDRRLKAAFVYLRELWPRSVRIDTLRQVVEERLREHLDAEMAETERDWIQNLVSCYVGGVVEISVSPSRFTTEAAERPRASRLARLQAEAGDVVTNLKHESVRLGELDRQVLRLLDGERDRSSLASALSEQLEQGAIVAAAGSRAADLVSQSLRRLANSALVSN